MYFYKRNDNPLTESDVAAYLSNHLPFNTSKSTRQWDYENPETGVYFQINWDKTDEEDEEYDGFINLNFSFSLNFFRPAFFGLESFPVIEKLVNDLDLYILDLQNSGEYIVPGKFPKDYIKDEWTQHNDAVTLGQFNRLNFKYLPIEKSNYLWHYISQKNKIEAALTEDIYVSGVVVVENKKDGQLYTIGFWPNHIPIILPRVDYVMIKQSYKKLFKMKEESGPVRYDAIMNKLGTYFEDFESEVPGLKVLRQHGADMIKNKFNALRVEGTVGGFGTRISLDSFVNIRPE